MVAIDARDARWPSRRGSDRYARELCRALRARGAGAELELCFLEKGWPGPELLWEEAALPLVLRRRGAAAVHSLNWTFPLVRPCPGVVTIHDIAWEVYPEDQPPKTRWKARTIAPRAARSAERVICVSEHTRDDVCDRYGVEPEKVRVIREAPGLPTATPSRRPGRTCSRPATCARGRTCCGWWRPSGGCTRTASRTGSSSPAMTSCAVARTSPRRRATLLWT
jgi:hypothetical protein